MIPEEIPQGRTPRQYWVPCIADFWWISFSNVSISAQLEKKLGVVFSFCIFHWKPDTQYHGGWRITSWLNIAIATWSLRRYRNWIAGEYYETQKDD